MPERQILVIRLDSASHGFFAQVAHVLNELLYAERCDYTPVVVFGREAPDGENPYYDERYGDNSWEYCFEPVSEIDPGTLGTIDPERLVNLTPSEVGVLNFEDPNSIYLYPYHSTYHKAYFDPEWYGEQRRKAHRVIRDYVRVKPIIADQVDDFFREHMDGGPVLGLHLRGTDKRRVANHRLLSRIIGPEKYRPFVDEYLEEHPEAKVFVATDQQQFLEQMKGWYGERVLSYSSLRSRGRGRGSNVFEDRGDGFRKASEVLIDSLLLSRCDKLIKCTSAVGEFAMYLDPDKPWVDVNHHYAPDWMVRAWDVFDAGAAMVRRPLRPLKRWVMQPR